MLVKVFTHYVIVPVPVEVPKSNIVPMVTVTGGKSGSTTHSYSFRSQYKHLNFMPWNPFLMMTFTATLMLRVNRQEFIQILVSASHCHCDGTF